MLSDWKKMKYCKHPWAAPQSHKNKMSTYCLFAITRSSVFMQRHTVNARPHVCINSMSLLSHRPYHPVSSHILHQNSSFIVILCRYVSKDAIANSILMRRLQRIFSWDHLYQIWKSRSWLHCEIILWELGAMDSKTGTVNGCVLYSPSSLHFWPCKMWTLRWNPIYRPWLPRKDVHAL